MRSRYAFLATSGKGIAARGRFRSWTRPSAKTILANPGARPFFSFNNRLAIGKRRLRRVSHAFLTAAPFRSVPQEAAVAEVFGTLSVLVGRIRMEGVETPNSCEAIWTIFV